MMMKINMQLKGLTNSKKQQLIGIQEQEKE
jgi:hypothetical protein